MLRHMHKKQEKFMWILTVLRRKGDWYGRKPEWTEPENIFVCLSQTRGKQV